MPYSFPKVNFVKNDPFAISLVLLMNYLKEKTNPQNTKANKIPTSYWNPMKYVLKYTVPMGRDSTSGCPFQPLLRESVSYGTILLMGIPTMLRVFMVFFYNRCSMSLDISLKKNQGTVSPRCLEKIGSLSHQEGHLKPYHKASYKWLHPPELDHWLPALGCIKQLAEHNCYVCF